MSALAVELTEPERVGYKMSRAQGRWLPTELLMVIADNLCNHRDTVAFGLTCKALYALTVKKQRQSLEVYFDGLHTACASIGAPKLRLLNQQAAMLTIVSTRDASDHFQDGLESWHLQDWNCRCRVFAKKTVAVDQLFHRNEYRLAKSVKELTLSGGFSFQADGGYSWTSHPFMRSSGFKALRPETLRVNLSWNDWDFDILHGMSTTNLRVLKLPIRLPSDCLRLRQALATMPSLGSLAITDIPDREEFLIGLEQIGKGILSCAATLRELDIEMTNFNRPVSWDGDERFIQPKDVGFFFRKIFSCPPEQELLGLFELHARQGKTPMMGAPLSLTKLRLKHVNLPWYSFGTIFNATTIKHLHLPFSVVDCEEVWGLLETYAHLDTLTDISHDMLSPRFLAFLKEQSSLKELTFARPQEQYDVGDVVLYGASAYMTILVSDEAPRVGPNAVAKYPSFEKFLSSLENKAMLKHLALPPDMYRMTRDCLLFIAQSLTGLEHLELGFDYKDPTLRRTFTSHFLRTNRRLKKITFLSLKQRRPLPDFDAAPFQAFVASLGTVSAGLKLVRYMPLTPEPGHSQGDIGVYYHRETPVDGEWWMRVPPNEGKQIFAEGRTPRIVPVGKWDWETGAE